MARITSLVVDFDRLIEERVKMINEAKESIDKTKEKIAAWQGDIEALLRSKKLAEDPGDTDDYEEQMQSGSRQSGPAPRIPIGNPNGRPGRQPGQISQEWRLSLERMFLEGGASSYEAVNTIAEQSGVKGNIVAVRDRIRSFIEVGYVIGTPREGFTVTAKAAKLFGFQKSYEAPGEG